MNVRGIFPSLGAGGSLIAAVLCAAVVFGGALAFRGGGTPAAEANAGAVTVPAGTVRVQTSSGGTVGRATPRASAGHRAAAGRTGRPRARTHTRARTRPEAITPRPIAPTTAPPAAATATPTPTSASPPVIEELTGTAQRKVSQVRAVVQPIIDRAPQPTQQHANSVTHALDQVAGTVDDVTQTLLPQH